MNEPKQSRSPAATPVAAVIWDFGGVVTQSPFQAFSRFEAQHGLPAGFLRTVNARDPHANAWARLERNEISIDAFDALFAAESRALGHEVRGARVLELLDGALRPVMVEALERLRVRLWIGCITNNFAAGADARFGPAREDKARIMGMFHHVIESAKAGVRKPDPRIYRMMTDALGVAPQECVYLDDLGINLKPARELGMRTIKVGEPEPALAELESMVGFALRG